MSKKAVEAVIGKAVLDSEFREALFANPGEVLAGYELAVEEVAALKTIDAGAIESFAGALDERISRAFVIGGPSVGGHCSGLVHWWDPEISEGPLRESLPRQGVLWEELRWQELVWPIMPA